MEQRITVTKIGVLFWIFILSTFASFRIRSATELWQQGGFDSQVKFQAGSWVMIGFVALILLIRRKVDTKLFSPGGPLFWYTLYVLFAVFSAIYSSQPTLTLFRSFQILAAIIILSSIRLTLTDFYIYAIIYILINWILTLAGFLTQGPPTSWLPAPGNNFLFYDAAPNSHYRFATAFGHPFVIGTVAAMGSVGIIAKLQDRSTNRIWYLWFILLTLSCVLTVTRTAIAGMIAGQLVIFIVRKRPLAIVAMAFFVTLTSLSESNRSTITEFLSRGQTKIEMKALTGRNLIYEEVLQRSMASPIFGEGFASARKIMLLAERANIDFTHAHNLFFEAFMSLGIIGVTLISLVLVVLVVRMIIFEFWSNRDPYVLLGTAPLEYLGLMIPLTAACITGVGFAGSLNVVPIFFIAIMCISEKMYQEARVMRKGI